MSERGATSDDPDDGELLAIVRATFIGPGPPGPDRTSARPSPSGADALAMLWTRHHAEALRRARQLGVDDPEDLVMDAMTRVTARLATGQGPSANFRAYLMATLRSIAIDQYRREKSDRMYFGSFGDDDWRWIEALQLARSGVMTSIHAPGGEVRDEQSVFDALSALPERYQHVLWWVHVEDRSPSWVAQELGLSLNATYALTFRARGRLRERYLQATQPDEGAPNQLA
jgi:RNA polymerase sigma factor (sigma-70 family)